MRMVPHVRRRADRRLFGGGAAGVGPGEGLRIISGIAKGRRLSGPPGLTTRPFPDRVREAVFSSLGEVVVDAAVLDLFAGTGSLGLEALSRGASAATFVEHDRAALLVLRRNIEAVGLGGIVVAIDVNRFVGAPGRSVRPDVR